MVPYFNSPVTSEPAIGSKSLNVKRTGLDSGYVVNSQRNVIVVLT